MSDEPLFGEEKAGRPVVDQSDAPRSNEKKYRSRTELKMLCLRHPRDLVGKIKVYCRVNHENAQDIGTRLWSLFLSGRLKDFFQPADWSTTCSSSSSSSNEEEEENYNYDYNAETGRPVARPGRQPLLKNLGGGADVAELSRSKFDRDNVERYAACHQKDGRRLGKNWVDWALRTGDWDAQIEEWLAEEAEQKRPKVSTNCCDDCPECEGKGYDLQFLYKTEMAKPCSRCKPAKRAAAERAQLKSNTA